MQNKKLLSKISRSIACLGVLAISTILSGCIFFPVEEEAIAPPLVSPVEISYTLQPVVKKNIETIVKVEAAFQAYNYYSCSFGGGGGTVKETYFKLGDVVKKGQIMAKLDSSASEETYQKQLWDFDRTRLRVEGILASDADEATKRLAKIDLEEAAYYLGKIKEQLDACNLIAPADGIVVFQKFELNAGSWVSGNDEIYSIADNNKLLLTYEGANDKQFTVGEEVEITFPGGDSYIGRTVSVPTELSPDAKSNPLLKQKVIFEAQLPENKVILGNSASVVLVKNRAENTLVISRNTLRRLGARYYVVKMVDDVQMEQDIVPGIMNDDEIEVLEGLQEGDQLIAK